MKASLILILTAAALVSAPLSVLGTLRLSRKGRYRGLLLPILLAIPVYGGSAFAFAAYGFGYGVLTLAILNLPLFASLATYVSVRLKRYNRLAAELRAIERAKKPTVTTTVAFRALVKEFHYASTSLAADAMHDVIVLTKTGTDRSKIATTYNLTPAELNRIEKAFDAYVARKNEEKKGEPYHFSPEQRELFLQMMVMSTPSAMGCGDSLLWDDKCLTAMIRHAINLTPSPASITTLLADCGLLPGKEEEAMTKTAEGVRWLSYEYNKIRMAALEQGAVIYWIYAPKCLTGKRYFYFSAKGENGATAFGAYTKTSGFSDFMNKLAQQSGASALYAVVCTDYSQFKNLENIQPSVRLFGFGKPAVFSDKKHI